ncbi:DUF4156 domain-containing protein [Entomobacter blattae]|uniref:DUF4156 domain-containing protein n=1 Tax=Entomobacter blattae TaxID=2762277 RepID=A0A7H1NR45_9PROT|nr:DUF4156 domain-containing protein [Entomobacter blattae]QNT78255.1 hypothetical protein JGUZn3_10270 [Entomobacter blattae]
MLFYRPLSVFLLAALCSTSLAGCAGESLDAGAETVKVVSVDPLSKACHFLGQVRGSNEMWISDGLASTIQSARNDLINRAYRKGANLVVVVSYDTTSPTEISSGGVVETGDAYYCTELTPQTTFPASPQFGPLKTRPAQ